jgi:hypothetical protein
MAMAQGEVGAYAISLREPQQYTSPAKLSFHKDTDEELLGAC